MSAFFIFLSLLIILFILSQLLHKKLSSALFRVTKNKQMTISLIAFLFFPGTLVHELAHFLMAHLLFVPTGKMALLPKMNGDHVTLGSVEIGQTDPLRRLIIGAAPFLIGTSLLFLTLILAERYSLWSELAYSALVIYILFELGNTMFSSKKDMEGALLIITVMIIVGVTLYALGFQLIDALQALFNDEGLKEMFRQASFYLLYPLGINTIFVVLLHLLHKMRR